MSASILNAAVITAQMLLVLAMSFALFRMTYGPRAQDRVLGTVALSKFLMRGEVIE
jgi:multicomponent K+:H+ antiporter subunit F